MLLRAQGWHLQVASAIAIAIATPFATAITIATPFPTATTAAAAAAPFPTVAATTVTWIARALLP